MATKARKVLWFGASTTMLAVMVYLSDFSKFMDALATAKLSYILPALICGLAVFPVFGYSWYRFLNQVGGHVSYYKSLRMFMSGQFMNSVTPVGQFGGEPFMAYVIKKNTGLKYEEAFSTVLSADIINAVPLFNFVIGGVFYLLLFGTVKDVLLQILYISVFVVALGSFLVYILWFKSGTVESIIVNLLDGISDFIGRGQSLVNSVEERMEGVEEAFRSIGSNPKDIALTAAVAHLSFLLQIISLYFILLSLGVTSDFTPLYFVIAVSGLANFAPTPGGSGAYEATMAGVLTLFLSMNFATGLLAGILFRLTTYWPGLVIGYIALITLESGEEE